MTDPDFTIGVEEEYLLVDADTLALAVAPPALMEACRAELAGQVSPEFGPGQLDWPSHWAELAAQGMAILMISSELPEILGMSDRILVMRQGGISGELSREEATEVKVLELALPRADAA